MVVKVALVVKIISKSHDHNMYVGFTCSRSSISNSIPTEVLLLQSQKYSSNNFGLQCFCYLCLLFVMTKYQMCEFKNVFKFHAYKSLLGE